LEDHNPGVIVGCFHVLINLYSQMVHESRKPPYNEYGQVKTSKFYRYFELNEFPKNLYTE
jgi:hypothetical protein